MYILLCCAAGMSTSMVVRRMQEEAQKQGKNYKIKAVDSELVKLEIAKADVVLIGPQVKYLLSAVETLAAPHCIPVAIIAQRDYGMCDGLTVLKQAEELVLR
ncbi:PTS sugar transporter subunit IIB [Bacillus gaemokensis]|uniref:PTS cellbiose transporter subunit IIB n=1 Tax=Bacillus gaemokensis TaxID=574375 RepID=A0A073KCJ4_9BACI|nr:PTS sugar transporter subunit IIB [Bacillus gaemokensis]KEK24251.1 PTS cellbiose transporter subunit IIB [Bacillus gaemokensis]KYG38233.1 PTS sugar transporter subunit IIB [Bacillus gaemokensis]